MADGDARNQEPDHAPGSLNRHALALIEQVRPYTGASPFAFGATRAKKPPRIPEKALARSARRPSRKPARSRELLGIENFCPHDLRRTAPWITAAGLPKLYAR
ncbi:MAG: hypothetical protein IPH06_13665 [Alphaproteobacteria bacterium]|nr:hypothetical protein [Alphaproteobacteria bacterium]